MFRTDETIMALVSGCLRHNDTHFIPILTVTIVGTFLDAL